MLHRNTQHNSAVKPSQCVLLYSAYNKSDIVPIEVSPINDENFIGFNVFIQHPHILI
jgi:hypothetical protein